MRAARFTERCAARDSSGRMLLLLCLGFLQHSSGQDVPCTVTQNAGQTLYSVPEFRANGCQYQWTNSTNVLANQAEKHDELVVMKSNRTLLTNKCLEVIHYRRDCISEKTPREVNCTTNCSGNAGPQSRGESLTSCVTQTPETKPTGISHMGYWIAFVGFILLLVGLFLCHKFRNKICSCGKPGKLRCLYAAVMMQKNPPNMADEEAQRV